MDSKPRNTSEYLEGFGAGVNDCGRRGLGRETLKAGQRAAEHGGADYARGYREGIEFVRTHAPQLLRAH